jgi:hypothetical protein
VTVTAAGREEEGRVSQSAQRSHKVFAAPSLTGRGLTGSIGDGQPVDPPHCRLDGETLSRLDSEVESDVDRFLAGGRTVDPV